MIYSYKATGDFAPTFISPNIRDWLGYEPKEYLEDADFWRRYVHPEDLAAAEAESTHLYKKGHHTAEYRFRKKDGTYCWVNDAQRLIRDEAGQPTEIIGSWSDVTDRKRAEEAAAAARDRIEYLLARSPAVIYSFKATGDYAPTFISPNIKELLGYEREEYLSSPGLLASPRPSRGLGYASRKDYARLVRGRPLRTSTDFARRTATIAGSATICS